MPRRSRSGAATARPRYRILLEGTRVGLEAAQCSRHKRRNQMAQLRLVRIGTCENVHQIAAHIEEARVLRHIEGAH